MDFPKSKSYALGLRGWFRWVSGRYPYVFRCHLCLKFKTNLIYFKVFLETFRFAFWVFRGLWIHVLYILWKPGHHRGGAVALSVIAIQDGHEVKGSSSILLQLLILNLTSASTVYVDEDVSLQKNSSLPTRSDKSQHILFRNPHHVGKIGQVTELTPPHLFCVCKFCSWSWMFVCSYPLLY